MSAAFLTLLGVLVTLVLLRTPIPFAMFAAGFAYLHVSGQDLGLVVDQVMNSLFFAYILLAIPMFVLAANVMNAGTISERLWGAANAAVGRAPGGLAHVSVLVSLVFSSMSGSAVADAAGPGMMAIRMMRKVGNYPGGFAVAVAAAGAVIAPIIPPSIPMVLYALNSGASVGALFLAGILPGLLIAAALMATVALVAPRMDLPPAAPLPRGGRRRALAGAILPMTLPAVLLGGIWSGAFTPTEAAAVAAIWAFLLAAFVYRALDLAGTWKVLKESMANSSVVMLLIAGAFLINYAVTAERLDRGLADLVTEAALPAWAFLLIVNLLFLLLGCVVDTGTLLLVLVPLLVPTVEALGIDLVHFGVVIVVNIMIGLVTPPFGLVLFVLGGLTGVPLGQTVRHVWPFLGALILCLAVITYLPGLSLALPRAFGF